MSHLKSFQSVTRHVRLSSQINGYPIKIAYTFDSPQRMLHFAANLSFLSFIYEVFNNPVSISDYIRAKAKIISQ